MQGLPGSALDLSFSQFVFSDALEPEICFLSAFFPHIIRFIGSYIGAYMSNISCLRIHNIGCLRILNIGGTRKRILSIGGTSRISSCIASERLFGVVPYMWQADKDRNPPCEARNYIYIYIYI